MTDIDNPPRAKIIIQFGSPCHLMPNSDTSVGVQEQISSGRYQDLEEFEICTING